MTTHYFLASGFLSEQIVKELHIQKAFVSGNGFSLEHELTENHLDEAQLKRVIADAGINPLWAQLI
jgi:DeoR/GlpR family transcriptional regulator of sugar metabolism